MIEHQDARRVRAQPSAEVCARATRRRKTRFGDSPSAAPSPPDFPRAALCGIHMDSVERGSRNDRGAGTVGRRGGRGGGGGDPLLGEGVPSALRRTVATSSVGALLLAVRGGEGFGEVSGERGCDRGGDLGPEGGGMSIDLRPAPARNSLSHRLNEEWRRLVADPTARARVARWDLDLGAAGADSADPTDLAAVLAASADRRSGMEPADAVLAALVRRAVDDDLAAR